jgi:hypothetical protein
MGTLNEKVSSNLRLADSNASLACLQRSADMFAFGLQEKDITMLSTTEGTVEVEFSFRCVFRVVEFAAVAVELEFGSSERDAKVKDGSDSGTKV